MQPVQIKQTTLENGHIGYSFEANNTQYDVFTPDNVTFSVWSKRKGYGGHLHTCLKVYYSLDELAARSKAFRNLAEIIKKPLTTVS